MKYLLKGPIFRSIMDVASKEWSKLTDSRVLYPTLLDAERMGRMTKAFQDWLAEAKTKFPPLGFDLKEETTRAFTDWLARKASFSDVG